MSYDPTKEYSLDLVQDAVWAEITRNFVQPLIETGIPDAESVRRNPSGGVDPYIAIQFGDLQQAPTRNMGGVQNDDYYLPVYIQCLAPSAKLARRMSNKMTRVILGFQTRFSGQVRKRPGGGMFPVQSSTGATEAFISPASYAVTVQLSEV